MPTMVGFRRRGVLARTPIRPMAIVVALVVGASALVTWQAARDAEQVSDLQAGLSRLVAHWTASHTALEEFIAADTSVAVATEVLGNQTRAARLCRLLRDGGPSPENVERLDDLVFQARIRQLCDGIERGRDLTGERIAQRTAPGSPAEQQYDRAFARVLADGGAVQDALAGFEQRHRRQLEAVQYVLLLLLCPLLAVGALVIRRREDQLRELAADREAVLDTAGEGIIAFDREGTLQYVNDTAARMLAGRPADLKGRPVQCLLAREDPPTWPGVPEWLRPCGATRREDRELLRVNGTKMPIEYTVTATGSGQDRWTVMTFRDIASRQRREALREAELEELRAIRETLVPAAIAHRPGLSVATCHVAAQDGVAGDFHLVTDGREDTITIVVGDVAGKGLPAARRAAYVRAVLATFAPYEVSPARLLTLANRSLLDATGVSERFVTAVCISLRPKSGTLAWACAGHPPPIELDSGRVFAGHPGLPLGLAGDPRLQDTVAAFPSGAGIVAYSDGLSEARPAERDGPSLLGLDRVSSALRAMSGATPRTAVTALRSLAESHSGGRLADDLCLVVARSTAASSSSLIAADRAEAGRPERSDSVAKPDHLAVSDGLELDRVDTAANEHKPAPAGPKMGRVVGVEGEQRSTVTDLERNNAPGE